MASKYAYKMPTHIKNYIREHYKGKLAHDLIEDIKRDLGEEVSYNQVTGFKRRNGLKSGVDTRINKEFREKYKEFCTYKKGNINRKLVKHHIGSFKKSDSGYLMYKYREGHQRGNWQYYHKYLWERKHGKVPKGYKIIFKNRNIMDFRMSNLMLVSLKSHIYLATRFKYSTDPDLTEVEVLNQEIKIKVKEINKRDRVGSE